MTDLLPYYELSMMQRMLLIWLFILCGFVLAFHVSQQVAERPRPWTQLSKQTKPYWYTFYVFEAFLLSQITHRVLRLSMDGLLGGYEEQLLDAIWIGLLGLEVLMVTGVALRGLFRAFAPGPKQKTQ